MHYHLIGDQGVSMRGIAKYLKFMGHIVSGSDLKNGGHKASNITNDIDVIVRSSAVNPGSAGWVEVDAGQRLGIKIMKRSEILKELAEGKKLIAISGAHGKTTVTAMAGIVLERAGFDPTVFVGDEVKELGNDVVRIGKSDWFVLEACEYDHNLIYVFPNILILTNIETEHLDSYPGGLPEIKNAFLEYINQVPDDGLIIACGDDENILDILPKRKTKARAIYYGNNSEKYQKIDFKLNIPGHHNELNALSVVALSDYLGIGRKVVEEVLKKFSGAHRRFEIKGEYNGSDLIDDYGHHPTEIKKTLEALKERYPDKKRIAVFWPHQYKRIAPLLDDFAKAFVDVDLVIIKPIFFVPGRDEILPIDSKGLVSMINSYSSNAMFMENDDQIIDFLTEELNKDSVLLTIGIPPVYKIIDRLLEEK